MATRRSYTDDERATALAALTANGGNVAHTARQLGIPEATLRQWANGDRHPEALQMSEQKKGDLADSFQEVAGLLLGGVTPAKIKKSPVDKLLTAAAIAVDKMQLLRGKPTTITESTRDQKLAALRSLLGLPSEPDDGGGNRPLPIAGQRDTDGNGAD